MDLMPVKAKKNYEEIVEQLKSAIQNGKFPPGSRLPSVRELSNQFAVGQAAVREALSALKAMGLITIKQGSGTYVEQFDPNEIVSEITRALDQVNFLSKEDIRSLLELRKIIEAGSAKLAARRRTKEDLEMMGSILNNMEKDLNSAVLGEKADWEFHYTIAAASKNPFLLTLMDSIAETIQASLKANRTKLYQIPGGPQRLLEEHKGIYHAILATDEVTAEKLIVTHLSNVDTALEIIEQMYKK
ncbi:FadR family transcriptional regulator [Fodinisporobacter ferrooxydans]|uniref:FadR family transcriptional regulator n=1 Tax=Fodinisporobacter ferrooxydans TaxID=2901836 RepID=A0ABY4CNV8_9BACL|nr:FadR family transcriptional regulator [Alicyclobacillaceae bacterium MYW30-H2]